MTGKERILTALSHREADRIPIDLGSTHATTIHARAYNALLDLLGYSDRQIELTSILGQTARVAEDILERFCIDTRGVWARLIFSEGPLEMNNGSMITDEWGIKWFMPNQGGLYYDMVSHPLSGSDQDEVNTYPWPAGDDARRFAGIDDEIRKGCEGRHAMVFGTTVGNGFLQTGNWLEGFEDFFCDLALSPRKVELIMDKVLETKIVFWDAIVDRWGEQLDIVQEQDDMGTQTGLLISPNLYRKLIKPRQRTLFEHIKKRMPHVKILFHSCGSIRPLIPDLIEVGIDILNPVQVSAAGMAPGELKGAFGKDITFWGGGVDTQGTLARGSPQEVKKEVRSRIEVLGQGGGYVFAPVHNIQADVPPENLVIMWETVLKYGVY